MAPGGTSGGSESVIPDIVEGRLSEGFGTCCSFNRVGTLLACGLNDGRIVVCDFVTRSVVRSHIVHYDAITSILWLRKGHVVCSASFDGTVVLTEVLSGKQILKVDFRTPVRRLSIAHEESKRCVVNFYFERPAMFDLETGAHSELSQLGEVSIPEKKPAPSVHINPNFFGAMTPDGKSLVVGTASSSLVELDADTGETKREVPDVLAASKSALVKHISFSRNGQYILLNCSDRVLRLIDYECFQILHEFSDQVNRQPWIFACFLGDDWVIGGSERDGAHEIYVWSRASGQLRQILQGPSEGFLDMAPHPKHGYIVSLTNSGEFLVWGQSLTENWSAFAPDFEEIETNTVYVEKEDEFDLVVPSEKQPDGAGNQTAAKEQEGESVDVVEVKRSDSDPEAGELVFIPAEALPDASSSLHEVTQRKEDEQKRRLDEHIREIAERAKRRRE